MPVSLSNATWRPSPSGEWERACVSHEGMRVSVVMGMLLGRARCVRGLICGMPHVSTLLVPEALRVDCHAC